MIEWHRLVEHIKMIIKSYEGSIHAVQRADHVEKRTDGNT